MENQNDLIPSKQSSNTLEHLENNSVDVVSVDSRESKVILCYPIISGNGGKHVATMLAHKYKELYPNKKVALIDFDFHHPHFIERFISGVSQHGIDNLLDYIDGDSLPKQLFLENMTTLKSGVDYLRGTKLGDKHIFICKSHIEKILKLLRSHYDKVFVSTSSSFDNAGTVYGINGADEVLLIAKNNFSNLRKIEEVYPDLKRLFFKERPMKLVINQYNDVTGFNLGNFITKHNVEGIGIIPYQVEMCDGANLMKNKLLNLNMDTKRKKERDLYKEILGKIVTIPTESK